MTYDITVTIGENSYPIKVYSGVAAPANRGVVLPFAPNITLNWDISDVIEITLTGNTTLVFENGFHGQKCLLVLLQDAVGGRTVTFPPTINLGDGVITLTTTPLKKDIIGFIRDENSNKYDFIALRKNL